MSDLLLILGICVIALAGFLIYVPAGFAILGLGMILFSVALADRREDR